MEPLDHRPDDNADLEPAQSAQDALKSVTQDLQTLQHDLVAQLSQDVRQLQAERSRLLREVEQLRHQKDQLRSQHYELLSQRQLAQQQVWAKQLAQAMATHLQTVLLQRLPLRPGIPSNDPQSLQAADGERPEAAYHLLSSLDTTLNQTLTSLRHDLNSYQSSLSQQIGRMQTLEQQGEAILEALVNRLSQQLQRQGPPPPPPRPPVINGVYTGSPEPGTAAGHPEFRPPLPSETRSADHNGTYPHPPTPAPMRGQRPPLATITAPTIAPEPTLAKEQSSRLVTVAEFRIGLILVILSTIALSLHNVVVGVMGYPTPVLSFGELGGYITLNSLGNSLMILWMRMLVVVPLMLILAKVLYKNTWKDIKTFTTSNDRSRIGAVIGSGCFLFLSQVLIYIAIAQIGPGVAVTILFMYPLITVPVSQLFFKDSPLRPRISVMAIILLGVVLTAAPRLALPTDNTNVALGVATAVASSIAFALYLVSMEISFRKLHPVPVSLIQFVSIFVLTSICLTLFGASLGVDIQPDNRLGLMTGGLVLGVLTLIGYLLNNFGFKIMKAAIASIVASSGPVVTALLAYFITPSDRTNLVPIQWWGIVLVTVGVGWVAIENRLRQRKMSKA